MNFINKILLI